MNIGDKIKKCRITKGLTRKALAQQLFVSDKTIYSWECERTEPDLNSIIKISELLEVSPSYLIKKDNDKNNIETEIKIKLSKSEYDNLNKLMKNNAIFIKESKQTDKYYQPIQRKFLKDNNEEINEWLRIGIRGNKKILNYKFWHENKYCDEYEVEIDNEENLDKILKIVGLEQIVNVEKTRIEYTYKNKYKILLDYVENLGYFVEIEINKYELSPLEEYDNLLYLCNELKLNLNNIDVRGYPYHLIYNK